ncbi:hypothetical protein DWV69_07895 [Clostridium sp. AF12-19]|nr:MULTISPECIES: hypothetical protein [unclassified Clostridium]RHS22186.1 hypothetical protein DWV71_15385 [Clostridium sp. AF12-28]RHS28083.1 hypothetical protein DWV69_07895 [Clostridium sp. AF12-19]
MKNTVMIDSSFYTSANKSLRSMAKSLESYQKDFDLLMSNRNELLKMYSSYSQIQISEMAESLRKTMDLYAKINASYLTNDLFSDSMRNTIESLAQSFKAYEQMNIAESAKAIAESINAMSKSLRLEQLKQLQQIDFSCMFADIVPKSTSLSDIVETAYSRVQNELEEDCDGDDSFTEAEIQEVLTEQATDSKGFQAKFANWTEKKKIQFFIIWQLICFIYGNFFQPYFQENVGIPVTAYVVSNVKELPEKGARIIGKIHENIEAIITENTNYYYRVTFTNENGEIIEGYVAKRNLKIIEEKKDAIDEIHSESE